MMPLHPRRRDDGRSRLAATLDYAFPGKREMAADPRMLLI